MTNREMFLLATSILFASTTAGMALQGVLHHGHGPRPGFDRPGFGPHGPEGRDGKPRFDFFGAADANKDGSITREEMLTMQQKKLDDLFATVDTNHDGKLSRDEMEKGRELMRAKWKARFEAERKEGKVADDAGAPPPEDAPAADQPTPPAQ